MKLNKRAATGLFLSLIITLSACGQNPVAGVTPPTLTENAPALTLSPAGQANQDRTSSVAAARGLAVLSKVTLENAGVPTTYIEARNAGGQDITLIGSVENGQPVFAELSAVPEGEMGTAGSPFRITALNLQGAVAGNLSAQGIADWIYNRLVSLIEQYKRAPSWLKTILRGPIKGVIKLIIGEAINRGCNYAYDKLVQKLHADGRWIPLGRALLCEILLG